jgi:glyoxylase-like metal-dependent hydrolase (beta-lactamase superfamily II)
VLFDTGQDRASVTDPGYFPGGATGILYDRLTRFDIALGDTLTARLEAIGYDLADGRTAVLSHLHQDHIGGLAELERRPGHGSRARRLRDSAPTGVPVAPAEQPAPPRASGRLHGGRLWLAPAVRAWRRPVGLVGATDHGRGGRDGRALGRRRLALQVLLADVSVQVVARSEQQATGHAPHRHRWLLSQHRAPRR